MWKQLCFYHFMTKKPLSNSGCLTANNTPKLNAIANAIKMANYLTDIEKNTSVYIW